VALLAGACGAQSPSAGVTDGSPAVVAPTATGPRLALPLKGTALPADIEPGGLDADRFAFTDKTGVAVLNLDLGSTERLPKPFRGALFHPTSLGVNLLVGNVVGAFPGDPGLTIAMAYDIGGESWVDVAAKLPTGHASTAIATDGQVIVGLDLGVPGTSAGLARAYALDTSTGVLTYLPSLPGGGVPVPRAVGGGRIAGDEESSVASGASGGAARRNDGWVWDLAAGGYTMLASSGGPAGSVPWSITNDTIAGAITASTAADERPFLYDAAAKHFTDLGMAGYAAQDVSDSGVLLVPASGWTGIIRDATSGVQVTLDAVVVGGQPTGIRPWALSDGWVVGLTAPAQGSKAAFGSVVAIDIGEGP
jgi:hypothetical protein